MRTFVSFASALVVTGLVMTTLPRIQFEPQGIVLPAVSIPPVSDQKTVSFYAPLEAPTQYRLIGWVTVQFHVLDSTSDTQQQVQQYATQLVQQAGGTGVIVTVLGHTVSQVPGAMAMELLQGMVIAT